MFASFKMTMTGGNSGPGHLVVATVAGLGRTGQAARSLPLQHWSGRFLHKDGYCAARTAGGDTLGSSHTLCPSKISPKPLQLNIKCSYTSAGIKDIFTAILFKEKLAFETRVFPKLEKWLATDQREAISDIEDNSGSNCALKILLEDFLARVFSGSGWGHFGLGQVWWEWSSQHPHLTQQASKLPCCNNLQAIQR